MTLREFLDNVRFGAAGTLCVAICGEEEYLDNFEAGMYWKLEAGNWHEGSESPANPEIPEEIMEAEVTQVETAPDISQMFANLSWNISNSYHFTVVLVNEPSNFNAKKYWSKKKWGRPVTRAMWPYSITEERWDELSKCPDFENALIKIIDAGILLLREYTEEDFAEMDAKQAEANRNAQKLACKISSYNDLMVAMNMEGLGTLYKKYWR